MRQYADAAALAAYPGGSTVPAGDADAHLRTASRIIDVLLRARVYSTDADGYPTDATELQALSDAACAIAIEAVSTGAAKAGGTQQYQSVGIGSVNLSGKSVKPGTVTILGWPIPAAALAALADVGRPGVWSG